MTPGTPDAVHAYLHAATRLLTPRTAATTRAELLGNFWQAHLDAQTCGLSPTEAWQQVLNDAGPAGNLAVRLAVVHLSAPLTAARSATRQAGRSARWWLLALLVGSVGVVAGARSLPDSAPNAVGPRADRPAFHHAAPTQPVPHATTFAHLPLSRSAGDRP